MAPNRYDVRTPRGDSFVSKTFAVVIDGAPVDLTEWTITAQLRRTLRETSIIHTWDDEQIITGSGVIDYKGGTINTGWLRLETPAAVTAEWPICVGEWDWQMARDGAVYTVVFGSFRVARDVTHQ